MKPHLFIMMILLLLGACSSGEQRLTTEKEASIHDEIEGVFHELTKAAETLDHERYFSFFDENNFSVLNADGTTSSRFESFKNSYLPQLKHIQEYNYLEFDPVNISVIDIRNAVLVNEYSAEVMLKSGEVVTASGAGVQFWSKRTGEWKLVHVSDATK